MAPESDAQKQEADNPGQNTEKVEVGEADQAEEGIVLREGSERPNVRMHDPIKKRMREATQAPANQRWQQANLGGEVQLASPAFQKPSDHPHGQAGAETDGRSDHERMSPPMKGPFPSHEHEVGRFTVDRDL